MTLQEELVLKVFLSTTVIPIVGVTCTYERTNIVTLDPVFNIQFPDGHAISYEHPKLVVDDYSLIKTLGITKDQQDNKTRWLERSVIAHWLNSHVNHDFLEEDIGHVSLVKEGVNVVMASNSMRFRGMFTLYFL